MGKPSGSTPQMPDPAVTIPLQTAANKESFNYMLDAQRVNQYSPYGSQTWEKTPTFDRAGYREAMGDWRENRTPGTPGTPGTGAVAPTGGQYVNDPNAPAGEPNQIWVPGGQPVPGSAGTPGTPATGGDRPDKADFTTNSWSYRQNLSPEQQAIFDANQQASLGQAETLDTLTGRVQDSVSDPIDFSSAPELTGSVDAAQMEKFGGGADFSEILRGLAGDLSETDPLSMNKKAANALYRQSTRYLDEQRGTDQKSLEARLAEQGFVPGTPGYAQAMETFQDTGARAYADARDRATTLGTTVGSTAFQNELNKIKTAAGLQGQDFSQVLQGLGFNNSASAQQQNADTNAATFGNTARTQGLAEILMQRNAPLNELNAMRTGTQITLPNNPAQYGTPNLDTPDIIGAYNTNYQNQIAQNSNDTSGSNAFLGLLGDAAGMFAGMPPGTVSTLLKGFGGGTSDNGLMGFGGQ